MLTLIVESVAVGASEELSSGVAVTGFVVDASVVAKDGFLDTRNKRPTYIERVTATVGMNINPQKSRIF